MIKPTARAFCYITGTWALCEHPHCRALPVEHGAAFRPTPRQGYGFDDVTEVAPPTKLRYPLPLGWQDAGGDDECAHGYAEALRDQCVSCTRYPKPRVGQTWKHVAKEYTHVVSTISANLGFPPAPPGWTPVSCEHGKPWCEAKPTGIPKTQSGWDCGRCPVEEQLREPCSGKEFLRLWEEAVQEAGLERSPDRLREMIADLEEVEEKCVSARDALVEEVRMNAWGMDVPTIVRNAVDIVVARIVDSIRHGYSGAEALANDIQRTFGPKGGDK